MTTTSSVSRLSSQEQAQLIYQILSDVYDKSPWTIEQVVADLALDTTEYFYVYNQEKGEDDHVSDSLLERINEDIGKRKKAPNILNVYSRWLTREHSYNDGKASRSN